MMTPLFLLLAAPLALALPSMQAKRFPHGNYTIDDADLALLTYSSDGRSILRPPACRSDVFEGAAWYHTSEINGSYNDTLS
jgi:hypothetical protein